MNEETSLDSGVTTFAVSMNEDPSLWCIGVLNTIEEHHGQYSHEPPYTILEVIGLSFSQRLRRVFERLGFNSFQDTKEGFRATKL